MDTINSDVLISQKLRESNDALSRILAADVFFVKAPMQPPVDDLVRVEIEGLKERSGRKRDKLVVLVETNGGYAETVERIVSVFRRHYSLVEFIIPNYAYSAGTLLVLSGDEIYMDYYSVLGPIDPQYQADGGEPVPGMGYLAKFQELLEKINSSAKHGSEDNSTAELAFLVKKFDPAKLFHIEQSIKHGKSLLRDWLPRYKFKDWNKTDGRGHDVSDEDRRARAEEIAEVLGDAKRWHSHGRGISIRELASDEIKLKIENFEDNPKLNMAVRHYHGLFTDYMQKLGMRAALHSVRGVRRVI
jgi:hypothetical protein